MTDKQEKNEIHDLRCQRARLDLKLTEAEIALKQFDLESKRNESGFVKELIASPLIVTIVGAALSVCLGIVSSWYQAQSALALEREKERHELIVKMISTDDQDQASKNLSFLVDSGLIDDPGGRIKSFASDPNRTPVLPRLNILTPATLKNLPANVLNDAANMSFEGLPNELQNIIVHSNLNTYPGATGKELFNKLTPEDKGRLLLLYSRTGDIAFSDHTTLAHYLVGISEIGDARIWFQVSEKLLVKVGSSKQFYRTSPALHQPRNGLQAFDSFKIKDEKGIIQLVFYGYDSKSTLVEIDAS